MDGKEADSNVELLTWNEESNYSFLDVRIATGRKHQIRQHLASIDLPVVGDRLYGNKIADKNKKEDMQLMALSLGFSCPISQQKKYYCLPKEDCTVTLEPYAS